MTAKNSDQPCSADFDSNQDGDLELVDATEESADFEVEETNAKEEQ